MSALPVGVPSRAGALALGVRDSSFPTRGAVVGLVARAPRLSIGVRAA